MDDRDSRPCLSQPAVYRIGVGGRLDESWSAWFDDMTLAAERSEDGTTVTILTGTVRDQPALHGLLARIRNLGLLLLVVERLSPQPGEDCERQTDPHPMGIKSGAAQDPPPL